jgi:hypothetical protein
LVTSCDVTLAQFVLNCLDEDERVALASMGDPKRPGAGVWTRDAVDEYAVGLVAPGCDVWGDIRIYGEGGHSPADAEHIARYCPARTLADVAVKRKIVGQYVDTAKIRDNAAVRLRSAEDRPSSRDLHEWSRAQFEATILETPVLLLASLYDDRPGYRDGWRLR